MSAIATRREKIDDQEAKFLAREMATAYLDRVRYNKYELRLSTEEAEAKAGERCPLSRVWEIKRCAPEKLTWDDLDELNQWNPEDALCGWEKVKEAAREALRSGDLAGAAMDGRNPRPWTRACFLAIRDELWGDWQPRNGVERMLLDMMAQAQASVFFWQRQTCYLADLGVAEDAEKAAAMVDRFARMFTRHLRALCNLRKAPLAVFVQNAGQVNVGGQQVNVAAEGNPRKDRRKSPSGRNARGRPNQHSPRFASAKNRAGNSGQQMGSRPRSNKHAGE